ncbi:SGNH/GDSL hydrolase family protein [Ilumatobacter sp.]|uniref:SGNH/GDSL hydrolase family protein n=1 Tax=Ilumatobacter sp. TaxID=1967498 RepID=UPI003C3323EF
MGQRTIRLGAAVATATLIVCGCGTEAGKTSTPTEADTATAPSDGAAPTEPTVDATSTNASNGDADPDAGVHLVVIGDSIPYNSPEDCPGCDGFVDRYADALATATGRTVDADNRSQHDGLTLPMLIGELNTFEDDLRDADAIIVGIAHNSIALNEDHPCGSNWVDANNTFDDWTKLTDDCATASAESYRTQYEELFSTIANWRAGEPTVLLTINRYSDWLGWSDANLTPDQEATTVSFLDAWNTMLCDAASSNGFTCVDVYHAFNGPDGSAPSSDLLAEDYTHPSDKGNELIAQLLAETGFAPLV